MRTKPRKVFVLCENNYKEISYAELEALMAADDEYEENHHFFLIHGIMLEVSESDYKSLKSTADRIRYQRRLDLKYNLLSVDAFDTEDDNGTDFIPDDVESIEDIATRNVMVDKLKGCLPLLTDTEQELINALFFRNLSEREWSAETGLPQKTINNRKKKILAKLKKLIES